MRSSIVSGSSLLSVSGNTSDQTPTNSAKLPYTTIGMPAQISLWIKKITFIMQKVVYSSNAQFFSYRVVDERSYDSADSGEKRSYSQTHVSYDSWKLFCSVNINGSVRRCYC